MISLHPQPIGVSLLTMVTLSLASHPHRNNKLKVSSPTAFLFAVELDDGVLVLIIFTSSLHYVTKLSRGLSFHNYLLMLTIDHTIP